MRRSNPIRPDGVMVSLSRHQFSDSCLPPPNALQEKFYWRTVTLIRQRGLQIQHLRGWGVLGFELSAVCQSEGRFAGLVQPGCGVWRLADTIRPMDIRATLADKQLKAKGKVEAIAKMLLDRQLGVGELIRVAGNFKDKEKGTCIEALEFATRAEPEMASAACLDFVVGTLLDEAPRVKWESAKVVANIAHLYPDRLADAVKNLLANSGHSGTVVRWSAARALGEIVKLRTRHNRTLVPAIEAVLKRDDEDKAIIKIYQGAVKKART